ncbi:MAG: methyltransferase [Candidatus Hydrogenedentes bacterium]|nr:methyltransferase [Candidatus Hydrogenedentota bacterium]
MTSRERVLSALNHRESDRVPVDFSGHRSSGVAAIAYARLRDHLGLPRKTIRVYDPLQQLAIVDEDVLERFGVDTIELGRGFALDDQYWNDWVLPDGTPCQMPAWVAPERDGSRWVLRSRTGRVIAQMPTGALYFEQTYYPYYEQENLDDIPAAMRESMWCAVASPPGPLADGPEGLERLEAGAKKLRASTSKAIIGLFGGNTLEMGQFFWRNDRFLTLLAEDPDKVHAFMDRLVEVHLANLERYLGAVGGSIDVILFGDDLGMQEGPQISPAMYREYFKPCHQRMWARAKQLADVKVMLHCCGGVRELLPDLIDAGLDAINPVQVSCRGMSAAGLKQDFGRDITFWGGGCDTQHVLPNGTPDAVRRHVREQVHTLRPGGGFVFQQVHNVLANVPPENVVAMFEVVRETC